MDSFPNTPIVNIHPMKYLYIAFLLFVSTACVESTHEEQSSSTNPDKEQQVENLPDTSAGTPTAQKEIRVMVVPCSNGYEYNLHEGDLNPSLEKYLAADERVTLLPFPLKEMKGSGYLGVYDKRDCKKILEKVDVDFLIMTRMKGQNLTVENGNQGQWGYATRILNVRTMQQFDGIAADKLSTFEAIDPTIQAQIDQLISSIQASQKE